MYLESGPLKHLCTLMRPSEIRLTNISIPPILRERAWLLRYGHPDLYFGCCLDCSMWIHYLYVQCLTLSEVERVERHLAYNYPFLLISLSAYQWTVVYLRYRLLGLWIVHPAHHYRPSGTDRNNGKSWFSCWKLVQKLSAWCSQSCHRNLQFVGIWVFQLKTCAKGHYCQITISGDSTPAGTAKPYQGYAGSDSRPKYWSYQLSVNDDKTSRGANFREGQSGRASSSNGRAPII